VNKTGIHLMIQFAQIDKLPPTDIGDNRCSSAYPFLSFKYKRVIPMHRTRISIRNESIIYFNIDNPSPPLFCRWWSGSSCSSITNRSWLCCPHRISTSPRFLCRLTALIILLLPFNDRGWYIRKPSNLPRSHSIGTFPRFVAIGFYFLS
jgi:hypothetical protein